MKSNKSDFKYILIQGLITLLIAFIPIYFYIDASIKNQDIKDKLDLQSYSNQVVKKIENFLEQNDEVFYFPRSNIFYSSLYDENKKEKFFTNLSLDFFEDDFNESNERLCFKSDLDTLNDTYKSSMLKLVKAEKLYEKK